MYIFMVDEWLKFPVSEYGGIRCVVAEDEDQVVQILFEAADDYYIQEYGEQQVREAIVDVVRDSTRLRLDQTQRYTPAIVKSFLT